MGIARRSSGIKRAFMLGGSMALLSACGSPTDPPPPPTTGSIAVSTATTGSSLDPDGYSVSVDGGAGQAIGVNASVTVGSLAPGQHDVQLSGIAANCTVSGSNPVSADVTAGTTATASFAITCTDQTGDLDVTGATTGTDLDADGYTVSVDGGVAQALAINGTISVTGLAAGDRSVQLGDVAPNCSVAGMNPRIVTIPAGATATTTFDVTCSALAGAIDATTSTTGVELDPDGYTVAVDGGAGQLIGINATVNFGGLSVGNHDVTLIGIETNCSVTGANPLSVAVTDGGTTAAAFDVACFASAGDITVTTQTTGASIDPNGYVVTVDGGSNTPIESNEIKTLTGFSAGNHDVELTGMEPNCTVTSTNPQTVAVTDGGDTPVTFDVSCSAITPLSGKIVFHSERDGSTDVFVMNTDGTAQTNLTNLNMKDQDADVSPDGSKIVFWSNRDGNNEIYVMSADGSGQTRLTNNTVNDRMPTWSPDGTQIAFVRGTSSVDDNIWVMNADGTGETNLTSSPTTSDQHPSWSPDGALIAFSSDRSGDPEVWTIDVATPSIVVNLTNNPGRRDGRPSWSPDGTKIAFDRNDSLGTNPDPLWFGDAEIMVMDADGSNVVRITTDILDFVDFQPAWSPDGSRLVFASNRDADQEIYTVDSADGMNPVRLTFTPGKDEAADYSP